MSYLLTILYSVFLSSIFRNFISISYTSEPQRVDVQLLVMRKKLTLVVGIALLFLIDWIAFLIIYPPGAPFAFELREFILSVIYIPTITSLALALIFAMDTAKKHYCIFLSLYFFLSTLADLSWVYISINNLRSITIADATDMLVISSVYIFLKTCVGVMFILIYNELSHTNHVSPTYITLLSCILKPSLIFFIYTASKGETTILCY